MSCVHIREDFFHFAYMSQNSGEFELIKKIMARDKVDSIYSSGRKCNFKGCEGGEYLFKVASFSICCSFPFVFVFVIGDHLQPINVKGWFWPGEDSLLESLKKDLFGKIP